jgi:hypothetical protein
MKKEKYIDLSFKRKLPGRCPIFEYCERRAMTIYLFSEYSKENHSNNIIKTLENANEIPTDFKENYIKMIGDSPEILRGIGHGYFSNACPEINLFEKSNSLGMAQGNSCTSGNWEKERKEYFEPTEFKHYSECSEFSNHLYENNFSYGTVTKKNVKEMKPCFTYLMFNKKNGLCKIGISENPNYREKTLQSEEPEIETIGKKRFSNRMNAGKLEKELHKKFEDLNVRGEWFQLSEIEIEYVLNVFNE